MKVRRSSAFLAMTVINCTLLFIFYAHSRVSKTDGCSDNRNLVKSLKLTDLCLFTEARYTRHPSMADLHSPFQDAQSSFDIFPSGSFIPPPYLQRGAK